MMDVRERVNRRVRSLLRENEAFFVKGKFFEYASNCREIKGMRFVLEWLKKS